MPDQKERVLGWILAGLVGVHVLLLNTGVELRGAALMILLIGAILRSGQTYLPPTLARIAVIVGIAAVFFAGDVRHPRIIGTLAAAGAALFLLQRLTPGRGMRVLFCILIMLTASALRPDTPIGLTAIIIDAAVLFLLAEQLHQPPEAAVSFWVSIMRSIRIIVPVGIVVTAVFWFFPNLSVYTPRLAVGFSGSGTLNPSDVANLAQSYRVAMTAHFADDQAMPSPRDLYWRGQVLESNDGFRWSVGGLAKRPETVQSTPPTTSNEQYRYSMEYFPNRGGIIPVLDRAVYVNAQRAGIGVTVLESGAAVLSVTGQEPLSAEVVSTRERFTDAPKRGIERANLNVPEQYRKNATLTKIREQIFHPEQTTTEKLRAVGEYFRKSGFRYTMKPGTIASLPDFLERHRRGFCEHYAAAAANLLRLEGVPARLVTGYRGGRWNPWLKTITVRDANAHAWVEAWDREGGQWVRFDPTNFVAPELNEWIEREMNSANWSWYRSAWSYASAISANLADSIERIWNDVTASEAWENADVILFTILVAIALYWMIRRLWQSRPASAEESMHRLLARLERKADRAHRSRHAGETPLAWLKRLGVQAKGDAEKDSLAALSDLYETGMYKADGLSPGLLADSRQAAKRIRLAWQRASDR